MKAVLEVSPIYTGGTLGSVSSHLTQTAWYKTPSLEQLSLQLEIGQAWRPQVSLGKGLFLMRDWMIVGPGISSTLTLVPTGPVSFSLDLRSFARAELLVVGTESVVVAPEFLNQLALVFLGARLLSSLLL